MCNEKKCDDCEHMDLLQIQIEQKKKGDDGLFDALGHRNKIEDSKYRMIVRATDWINGVKR